MAFDSESSESTPIGTFSIPKDGKAIDCRKDGSKVNHPMLPVLPDANIDITSDRVQ